MPRFLLIAALALSATLLAGEADAAAFCAYAGGRAGYENCGYYTWEQCLIAVNGRGGQCMRNPHDSAYWAPPYGRDSAQERVRRPRSPSRGSP